MVDRHEQFRTWSLLAAISPEPSVRAGAEYAPCTQADWQARAKLELTVTPPQEAGNED